MNKNILKKAAAVTISMTVMSAADASDTKIDAFYFDLGNEFINALSVNVSQCAAEKGLKVKTYNAADDLMLQSEQIDSALTNKSTNFLLNLVDTSYAINISEALKGSDSRVIFVNRLPDISVLNEFEHAVFIGTDPKTSGAYQVEILKEYIDSGAKVDKNANGTIDIVLLKGEADHQDTRDRTQALLSGLRDKGIEFKIVHTEYANWGFKLGYEAMDRAVTKNGYDNIELIVANNDAMALGAIARINEDKYNISDSSANIPVIGIDAIKEAVEAVDKGIMIGTVCNDSSTMAKVAVDLFSMPDMATDELAAKYNLDIRGRVIAVPYTKITRK